MPTELRPARLMPPAATTTAAAAEKTAQKEFYPEISNTPDLPVIKWSLIGGTAPGLPDTPAGDLPKADAVVITWAEPEWAALQHVFCGSGQSMPYSSRNQPSWPGWQKYDKDMPAGAGSDWAYWGYYRLVTMGTKNVLLFKSNTHLAARNGQANLSAMITRILGTVQPGLLLSVGTAGGTITTDHVGTVNTVNAGTMYSSSTPEPGWKTYSNAWQAGWQVIDEPAFAQLLFPIPTIASDLNTILTQFNAFYHTSFALADVNVGGLDMGDATPWLKNMTAAGAAGGAAADTSLLTATSFVVGTSDGNFSDFACIEMDDAVIAEACQGSTTQFGFIRNISDPVQNVALPTTTDRVNWGSAIYHAYGFYTSYNGALAAWGMLSADAASHGSMDGAASHQRLEDSYRVVRQGATATGQANPYSSLEVSLKLRRKKNLPELHGRPEQAMTREELAGNYGASQQDIDKVIEVFGKFGLHLIQSNAATRTVRFSGTVTEMEKAFLVKLFNYSHPEGSYRGRVGYVQVPGAVKDIVVGVFGLDNRRIARRKKPPVIVGHAKAAPSAQASWYIPSQLATHYNFPPGDGSGQTVGLLEFGGGYFPADLQQFCKLADIENVPTVVPISTDGTSVSAKDGAEGEVMMDIEVVAGVCPKSTIAVYFAEWSEHGWITALDAATQDSKNNPGVISASWGAPEDTDIWTKQAITQFNETLMDAANLGITVCIAAGDDGSSDADTRDGHAHVDFPGSSPYVLSVGGTTIPKNGTPQRDIVWFEGDGLRAGNGGSTGGGVSTVFQRPSWQAGIDIPSVNPGSIVGRCIPDLSANADWNASPYLLVVDGGSQPNGGTSAATPLVASLIALINAKLPSGKRVGYLTPVLYQKNGSPVTTVGSTSCIDVVSGDNNTAKVGGYKASVGYDAVSGWGVPNGMALLSLLQGGAV